MEDQITPFGDDIVGSKLESETPAPLAKDYETFNKNYKINSKDILITDEYKLSEGESIYKKEKIIIKEYNNEYIKKIESINNLIDLEYTNLFRCKSKFIIKMKDFYISKEKILLVLEYFDCH